MALKGHPRAFLGIDINSSGLSLVELINRGSRIELSTYAYSDIPPAVKQNQSHPDADSLKLIADLLSQMIDRAHTSADAVVFSLLSSDIFSAGLELPSMSDRELSAAILFKAQEMVPTELDDMVITATRPNVFKHDIPLTPTAGTCQVVLSSGKPPPSAASPNETIINQTTHYLIHAIPKTIISWYRQLAQKLDLHLVALEAEVFPLLRVHPVTSHKKSSLFIKINQTEAIFYIADYQTVRLIRIVDNNGIAINSNTLLTELDRIITIYRQNNSFLSLGHVYLIGDKVGSPNLASVINSYFKIPVTFSQPFGGLTYPQGVGKALYQQGPLFTVAVGLAQRDINDL